MPTKVHCFTPILFMMMVGLIRNITMIEKFGKLIIKIFANAGLAACRAACYTDYEGRLFHLLFRGIDIILEKIKHTIAYNIAQHIYVACRI